MKSTPLLCLALACLVFPKHEVTAATTLSGALQSQVRKATFEIVMKKPETDSLTYEKPLPLELLPFSERNDKYMSVGSAFSIGNNRFVTAAHVVAAGFNSQYGEPAVRESDGSVHPISAITRYSMLQDFVEFSCDACTKGPVLKVNRDPQLDSEVFAVGNALGEGIVVRDGLLTSMTPETRYGDWKWLRFSAAASPGNSGGPLLDSKGNVIGIVLRKSESENLNYALPISVLLDSPANTAQLDTEMRYWLPVLKDPVSGRRQATFTLPRTYAEVAQENMKFLNAFMDDLSAELLHKNADQLFPKGAGAAQLLYLNLSNDTPAVIAQKDDATWDAYPGENSQSAQLPDNGYVTTSGFKSMSIIKIRRPDSADPVQFYNDSASYMDTLLKLWSWKRSVGREDVRITSMGKAKTESEFIDHYGRKWQQRLWQGEYQDVVATSLALPTPEGFVGLIRWSKTAAQHDAEIDLRSTTDFMLIAYAGTLKQWQEYLAQPSLQPQALTDAHIAIDYGKQLGVQTPRFNFSFSNSQQKIQPDGHLTLALDYIQDKTDFSWGITGLTAVEDAAGDAVVSVSRHVPPAATLPREYAVDWQKLTARQPPYAGTTQHDSGVSSITAVYPYPGKVVKDPPVIYTLQRAITGDIRDKQMQAELKKFSAGLQVAE